MADPGIGSEVIDTVGTLTCSPERAKELTEGIRRDLTTAWDKVAVAYQERAWAALGYRTWDDYLTAEFGTVRLQLPREARSETVRSLRDAGLSTRAIAAATGVGKDTVARDLAGVSNATPAAPIVGTDGKRYNATRPTALDAIDDPGEADAIVDLLEEHYGDDLTDEDVAAAVAENLDSKQVPNFPTKPDLGGGISHPARYTETLLPVFADILNELGDIDTVLDPFAGTGRIHTLTDYGYTTVGIEIEPEWAGLHPDTLVGSALELPFDEHHFDAVVTSPTYGNRLADSHNASDPETRRSYTHDLGRKLHADNSGAMQWGKRYRDFHEAAWNEAYRVLRPGGALILNIKDHVRNGKRQEVPAWHLGYLLDLGFRYRWHVDVAAPSFRAGANSDARFGAEIIYVLERGA